MSIDSVTRPGMALGMFGVTVRLPTVVTSSPPMLAGDGAHAGDDLGGRDQRVVTDAHRRGAGVVLYAVDRHTRPRDRHDALDHADRQALLLEKRPLLDVQLEVGAERPRHAGLGAQVADPLQLVDQPQAVLVARVVGVLERRSCRP